MDKVTISHKWLWSSLLVFIVGSLILLYACMLPRFIDDDTDVITGAVFLAKTNIFSLGYVHGALSFILVKLSGFLFGTSAFGWRVINLLFSLFNLLLMYTLLRTARSKIEAFFALTLSICNCYLIFYTAYVCEEIYLFTMALLAIQFFYLYCKNLKNRDLLLSGLFIGLGLTVKIQILLLMPGFILFLLLSKKIREQISLKMLFLLALIITILGLPYAYSLYKLPYFTNKFSKNMICLFRPSMNFLHLFLANPLTMGWNTFADNFGYTSIGFLLGAPCLASLLLVFSKKKDVFTKLMCCIFFSICFFSFFLFCGYGVEPRHLSLAIIPAIALLSIALRSLITSSILAKILVGIYLFCLCVQASTFSIHFEYFTSLHSKISLQAWDKDRINVDLNDLSKEFVLLTKQYNPTLVVFPAQSLDSTSHFFASMTGEKSISSLFTDRYLWNNLESKDIETILIFLTPKDNTLQFMQWADNNSYLVEEINDLHISLKNNTTTLSLPVSILLLSSTKLQNPNDIDPILVEFEGFFPKIEQK